MDEASLFDAIGLLGIFSILIGLFCLLVWAVLWWVIFKKAGYNASFLLGILMAVPIVNIVLFLVFALGEWPILRFIKR